MLKQDEAVKQLRTLWEEMKAKFPKAYSVDRLEQLRTALATAEMAVTHLHDEATREEHDVRQADQVRKMVHGSRDHEHIPSLTEAEAKARVEAGERV